MELFVSKLDPIGREVQLDRIIIPNDAIKGRVQKSLERLGVLSTILLRERAEDGRYGRYDIVEGRGRVLDYLEKGLETIWALVIPASQEATPATLAAASLSGNLLRRNNPAHEAMAIKDMVYTALAPFGVTAKTKPQDIQPDQLTRVFKTLSKELDFDPNILKARWRLLLIPKTVMEGVLAGTVAPTVAVELSKKPAFVQEVAEAHLKKVGKLTGKALKELQMSWVRRTTREAGQADPSIFDGTQVPSMNNGPETTEDQLIDLMASMIRQEGWTVTRLRDVVKAAYNSTLEETT